MDILKDLYLFQLIQSPMRLDNVKVNVVIHPDSIHVRNYLLFFWNFGLNY